MNKTYKQINRQLAANENLVKCANGYIDSENCSWYHKSWLDLRFLGMVSNPFWHIPFFEKALSCYTNAYKEVLVLGTADFSMPLLCSYFGINRLDICDVCFTPLNFCIEAAKILKYEWNVFQQNVFDGINKPYDVIINDAFLSRFDTYQKAAALTCISDALKDNGVYITTIRKGGTNDGRAVIPSPEQKARFIKKAVRNATEENTIDNVENTASLYINNIVSYPIESIETIKSILPPSLKIDYYGERLVEGECAPTTYFEIVFKKNNQ